MSVLDSEDKIFNDIEEKTFDIIIEEEHTPDYHQAWWDILGYVLNNDKFSRIIKADVLLTYKQSFWPYEINGFGAVPNDKTSWINIILYKKKYFGILGIEKINYDLRHLKFSDVYDTRMIALDSYIISFMSDSPLDRDLFNETRRHSILYQLFNIKYIGCFWILYNRGWFRDNYLIDEKVIISRYKEYLEKILYKLRKKNINIDIDKLNSFILSRFNKGIN